MRKWGVLPRNRDSVDVPPPSLTHSDGLLTVRRNERLAVEIASSLRRRRRTGAPKPRAAPPSPRRFAVWLFVF
ncbi:unnamed protein product [Caenorhabditis auriculariae]|uniref:Uncharacterized protein n=1 Tax=Caenorhabditis auriculariae TaxID=2777116 RepID=A0A8S1H806_9PELO|nr:unnamed protein product [Caenorhabditis auriculariae]